MRAGPGGPVVAPLASVSGRPFLGSDRPASLRRRRGKGSELRGGSVAPGGRAARGDVAKTGLGHFDLGEKGEAGSTVQEAESGEPDGSLRRPLG